MLRAVSPRRALAVLALAVAIGAAGATGAMASERSAAATGKTIRVGLQQGYNGLPFFVGVRHGFFKKAGITDVKFSLFSSLPAMLTAVAQGQLDIGSQTIPAVVSYNRATSGTKLSIVAPSSSGSNMWFAKNDAGIPVATKTNWKSTVLGWKGKRIGVPAPNGILDLITKYLAKEAGLQPDEFRTVVVGVGPPAVAALQQGFVDVISGDALTLGLIKDFGRSILSFPHDQGPIEFQDALAGVLFTSETAIQADRALYAAFADGLVKARAFMRNPKNKKAVMNLLTGKIGLSAEEAASLYDIAVVQFAAPSTSISRRTVGQSVAGYVKTGIMPAPAPPYDFFVADFAK